MGRYDAYEDCILSGEGRMKLEYYKTVESERFRNTPMQVAVKCEDNMGSIKIDGAENWMEVYAVMMPMFAWVCKQMITSTLDENEGKLRGKRVQNEKQCAALVGETIFSKILHEDT